jgi:hypothetical protein
MVLKENFSRDMVDLLTHDVRVGTHALLQGQGVHPKRVRRRAVC